MKTAIVSALVVLTLTAPSLVQAAPQAAPPPPRFCITLEAVEVSGDTSYSVTPGPEPAAGVFEEMLKKGVELTEVSLVTPNDFSGSAESSQLIVYSAQDQGKPTLGFVRVPTFLEALPHLNPDGTITVSLKIMVSHTVPAAAGMAPVTTSQLMTTKQTFKDGGTLLFGGAALPGKKSLLMFVSVRKIRADTPAH